MDQPKTVPNYALFGETEGFPDLVHAERIIDRAGQHDWSIRAHRHQKIAQVFIIIRGAVTCRIDGQRWDCDDKTMFYLPPGCVHAFEFRQGTEGVVLSLHAMVLNSLGASQSEIAAQLERPWVGTLTEDDTALADQISKTYQSASRFRTERMLFLGQALLAKIAERGETTLPNQNAQALLRRLDAEIAEHLDQGRSPADYAKALSLTPGHLNRVVREATGGTLSGHIEQRVMTEACRLLVFTRLSVAEVGHRLGYADPAYFSRRFKLSQGETPSGYRARFAGS